MFLQSYFFRNIFQNLYNMGMLVVLMLRRISDNLKIHLCGVIFNTGYFRKLMFLCITNLIFLTHFIHCQGGFKLENSLVVVIYCCHDVCNLKGNIFFESWFVLSVVSVALIIDVDWFERVGYLGVLVLVCWCNCPVLILGN